MNVKNNRCGKWNIVDGLIILLAASMIMILGYIMFFADGTLLDSLNADGNTKTVEYTFIVEPVDDDLLVDGTTLPIEVGDVMYHLSGKFSVGDVIEVGEKAAYMVQKEQGADREPVPGQSSFVVKVEAQAVLDGDIYYVNGEIVCVGEQFSFSTPYFTGVCKCDALEEVTADE